MERAKEKNEKKKKRKEKEKEEKKGVLDEKSRRHLRCFNVKEEILRIWMRVT